MVIRCLIRAGLGLQHVYPPFDLLAPVSWPLWLLVFNLWQGFGLDLLFSSITCVQCDCTPWDGHHA